jgi:hypothetical protein
MQHCYTLSDSYLKVTTSLRVYWRSNKVGQYGPCACHKSMRRKGGVAPLIFNGGMPRPLFYRGNSPRTLLKSRMDGLENLCERFEEQKTLLSPESSLCPLVVHPAFWSLYWRSRLLWCELTHGHMHTRVARISQAARTTKTQDALGDGIVWNMGQRGRVVPHYTAEDVASLLQSWML